MEKVKKGFCLFLVLSMCLPSYAQDITKLQDWLEKDFIEDITLISGEATAIKVSSPTRVSVRNPEVADIDKVSEEEVVIVAKEQGHTALKVWDKEGEKLYNITVLAFDLGRIRKKLQKIIHKELGMREITLKINEATSTIMVIGEVEELEREQVTQVLRPFKEHIDNLLVIKKERKMVEIDCHILELRKSELDRLGLKWQEFIQIRQEPYKAPTTGGTIGGGGVQTTLERETHWTALWGKDRWSRDALTTRIDLLVQEGKARELSRPKLLCLSGEESTLTVGGEVPYVSSSTTTAVGTSVTIEYKDYGVILKIQPHVLKEKRVLVDLGTEVSELDWANAVSVSGTRVPAFTKREATTVLNLTSGDTVFIAGLIQNKEANNIDKMPGLGEVPIVGALFRSKEFRDDQTELVISLTPRLVELESEKEEFVEQQVVTKEDVTSYDIGKWYRGLPDEMRDYIVDVQRTILDNVVYPRALLKTGWEGNVVLKLRINRRGRLEQVRMVRSSGYRIFDEDAMRLVQQLSFSPFPPYVEMKEIKIEVPIAYRADH